MKFGQEVTVTVGSFAANLKAKVIEQSSREPSYYWLESTEEKFYYRIGERLYAHKDCIKEN